MQNSSSKDQAEGLTPLFEIEIVPPADGRGETGYFLAICAAIIVFSTGLLWALHTPTKSTLPELPSSLSNLATQISNAMEEIRLLEDAGLISAPYELQDLPLPQSASSQFQQQDEHCFVLHKNNTLFAVEYEQSKWHANWANSEQLLDCHAALQWHPLNR